MIKLELFKPIDGKTTLSVTPSVANDVKRYWLLKDYQSEKQKQFIENVMKIKYSKEETYCLHRYKINNTFVMGGSKGYIIGCYNCEYSFATDTKPENLL